MHALSYGRPYSGQGCPGRPCRNRSPRNGGSGQGLSPDRYRTAEQPSGSWGLGASPPYPGLCCCRQGGQRLYAGACRLTAVHGKRCMTCLSTWQNRRSPEKKIRGCCRLPRQAGRHGYSTCPSQKGGRKQHQDGYRYSPFHRQRWLSSFG